MCILFGFCLAEPLKSAALSLSRGWTVRPRYPPVRLSSYLHSLLHSVKITKFPTNGRRYNPLYASSSTPSSSATGGGTDMGVGGLTKKPPPLMVTMAAGPPFAVPRRSWIVLRGAAAAVAVAAGTVGVAVAAAVAVTVVAADSRRGAVGVEALRWRVGRPREAATLEVACSK
jgi:hypothetical protein